MADKNSKGDDTSVEPLGIDKQPTESKGKAKLTAQVMQNPQVLAALQERLDSVAHTPSSYIETLPKAVKRRINALKHLQVKCAHIEAKFYEEVHELEWKYAALYQPYFEKWTPKTSVSPSPPAINGNWLLFSCLAYINFPMLLLHNQLPRHADHHI